MLLHVARIFDPAGWATPVIIAPKIIAESLESRARMRLNTSRTAAIPMAVVICQDF